MDKKKENRIVRLFETLVDEKDVMLENIETLIQNIKPHIDHVKTSPGNSQIDLDSIVQYQMEVSQLLADVNLQVLKALKHITTPELPVGVSTQDVSDGNEVAAEVSASSQGSMTNVPQKLKNHVKQKNHSQITDHNLANSTLNGSYQGRSLENNELIKIICANLGQVQSSPEPEPYQENISSSNMRNRSLSPSQLSETEFSSTFGSVQISNEYDNGGIEVLKENVKKFTKKLEINESTSNGLQEEYQKSKSSLNFQYETPVKGQSSASSPGEPALVLSNSSEAASFYTVSPMSADGRNQTVISKAVKDNSSESTNKSPNTSNDNDEVISVGSDQVPEKLVETGFIENEPNSDKNVFKNLENNRTDCDPIIPEHPSSSKSTAESTALTKLMSKQRHDRHEEVVQQALESMPDIRLVPAEPVFRNDFNGSDTSSTSSKNGRRKTTPIKNMAMCDLTRTSLPKLDEVCVFSHIESPSEFYIQIVNNYNVDAMDEINNKIGQKLRGSNAEFASKDDAFLKLGKYCLAYVLEKKGWFRVEVLDWKLGTVSTEVDVQSVDYGFKASISFKYLRSMIKEVADIPMLSIKCYFPYLYPRGSTKRHLLKEWSEESIEVMKNIANFSGVYGEGESIKWFRIKFVMYDGDDKNAIELIELEDESVNPHTFGEYLISFGAAVEIIEEYDDPALAEFLEDIDELENADNVNELILGYDAQDEARICRFTRKDGTCYKGKNCHLEHVPLPKGGYTTDKLPIYYGTVDELEQPVEGDNLQVFVTEYIDSCTYLVQLVRNPVRDNDGISMDRDLKNLIAAMNQPKVCSKFEPFKVAPSVGEVVLVLHTISRIWMRAIVRSLQRNEIGDFVSAEVFLADFGEILNVKIKEVRQMKEEFIKLPFQVIEIYLEKFKHNPSCDREQSRKFFQKHIAYKNFLAKFRSSSSPWCVQLKTFKGCEIGQTLVKEGFAVERKRDLNIGGSCKLGLE